MTLTEHLPILIIVVPLFAAVIMPLTGVVNRSLCWYFTVAVTFVVLLISVSLVCNVMETGRISYWLGGWEPPWGIEYVVDSISAFVLLVVSFIAFAVAVYARRSVEKEIPAKKVPLFYAVYLLFITGSLGITITGDIFNLYVFLEITSLSIYTLIAMGPKRRALIASFNYLILGTIAGTFVLIGVGYLYMVTGTLNMADLRVLLPELYGSSAVLTAFAFFTVGLSLKLALFPLHIWLPNAYSYAPSVVSAIVAATATKVSAYVLFRVLFTVFTVEFDLSVVPVTYILIVFSSVAIIMGSVIALSQTNIKRMLAYSSIGQIGYIVMGAALTNELALTGSIIHIFNHALMKGSLFLVVGIVVYRTGVVDISGFKGLGKKMPITMAAFTLGALSMIGAPLTVGFVSKWYLALGAIDAGMWFLVPVILISSILTAIYFWRVVEKIYFHAPDPAYEVGSEDELLSVTDSSGCACRRLEAPVTMLVPTIVLSILCVLFGIVATLPVGVASRAAKMLLGGG
jgi:multicomponent Na+:H+ antiporter subunit D